MDSISKTAVSREQLNAIANLHLGGPLTAHVEMEEGWYNTAFRLETADGCRAVIKIAPPDEYVRLRYEQGLMASEVAVMRLVAERSAVPVPKILAYDTSRTILGQDFLIMEFVEGAQLDKVRGTLPAHRVDRARCEFGAALLELHSIHGEAFGVFGQATFTTWREAFVAMMDDLALDGKAMDVDLPWLQIEDVVLRHADALESVVTPTLIHWDCWEPNLLIDEETGKLNGIIDFERAMWADPLMESAWIYASDAMIEGYGRDLRLEPGGEIRRALYSLHLWVLMAVETPYRKYPTDEYDVYARAELVKTLAFLEQTA